MLNYDNQTSLYVLQTSGKVLQTTRLQTPKNGIHASEDITDFRKGFRPWTEDAKNFQGCFTGRVVADLQEDFTPPSGHCRPWRVLQSSEEVVDFRGFAL